MPQRRRFLWRTPKYPNSHEIAITETTGGRHDIACVDRISNLPVEIIREILFLVPPKDAARARVWSKRWLRFWDSLSDIYLENGEVGMLFLRITVDKRSSCELLVKKWINFALQNNVKTLHLAIKALTYEKPFHLLSLSGVTFLSATLVVLSIKDCEISSDSNFMFPNLRSLFLYDVWPVGDDFVFADFIAGLPRIEELVIEPYPECVDTIVVPNPSLKFLKARYDAFDAKLQVKSRKLESVVFSYLRLEVDKYEFGMASPKTVKNLTLERVFALETTLSPFINRFPQLENLVIDGCRRDCFSELGWLREHFGILFVSHQHLANFVLKLEKMDRVDQILLYAPNLKSLEYYGGLTSFRGTEASSGLECVKLHLRPKMLNARWYIWLRSILVSFAHSKHLSLICENEQDIVFPDELTETLLPPIHGIKNLELQINSSTANSQEILDGFIWIFSGLRTLSLTLGSISKIFEFHREDDVEVILARALARGKIGAQAKTKKR